MINAPDFLRADYNVMFGDFCEYAVTRKEAVDYYVLDAWLRVDNEIYRCRKVIDAMVFRKLHHDHAAFRAHVEHLKDRARRACIDQWEIENHAAALATFLTG